MATMPGCRRARSQLRWSIAVSSFWGVLGVDGRREEDHMKRVEVAVVGAGPAGLACAVELRRAGVPSLVLERADHVAASWRAHYDRLRLNTSRWFSQLPGSHYPPRSGMFPHRDAVIRCLEQYAEEHNLELQFRSHVSRVDPKGDAWILRTSRGDIEARHVIVATGLAHTAVVPHWPNREAFRGAFLHSSAYQNPRPFVGQSVLVVGAGASGMEIAQDLADANVRSVYLAVRTPPNILLRSFAGLPGDPIALLLQRLPPRVADSILAWVRRAALGDLSEFGLPAPAEGPFERFHRDWSAPAIVDRQVIDSIRSRRIEVVPGIDSFEEDAVRLGDGRRLEVDSVVAATGYRCGLEPLVGHLDVLDDRGMPRCPTGDEVLPGLRFVAFRPSPGLIREMGRQARRIASSVRAEGGPPRE